MQWNKNKSLTLSKLLVLVFALVLLAADLLGWRLIPQFFTGEIFGRFRISMLVSLYVLSVPAWAALVGLYRLLSNLREGQVFTPGNIRLLRIISWCCFCVAGISLLCYIPILSMAGYRPLAVPLLGLVPLAAALMGLIVRIVKNVFEQAAVMKDELDYTV